MEGLPLFMVSQQLVLFRSPGPHAFPTTPSQLGMLSYDESIILYKNSFQPHANSNEVQILCLLR